MSTSTSLGVCLWYKHHYSFLCIWGGSSNEISWAQTTHHTSCIHNGLHAGKWPDPMISKPDSVSTLGYHWTDHTGGPLEPQVSWDATGTTLADASYQWCPSGDPVLICIIWTHWKATGRPLEMHWLPTILSPVAFQCTLGSKFQAHWIVTGLPLNYHWLRVRVITMVKIAFFVWIVFLCIW